MVFECLVDSDTQMLQQGFVSSWDGRGMDRLERYVKRKYSGSSSTIQEQCAHSYEAQGATSIVALLAFVPTTMTA